MALGVISRRYLRGGIRNYAGLFSALGFSRPPSVGVGSRQQKQRLRAPRVIFIFLVPLMGAIDSSHRGLSGALLLVIVRLN